MVYVFDCNVDSDLPMVDVLPCFTEVFTDMVPDGLMEINPWVYYMDYHWIPLRVLGFAVENAEEIQRTQRTHCTCADDMQKSRSVTCYLLLSSAIYPTLRVVLEFLKQRIDAVYSVRFSTSSQGFLKDDPRHWLLTRPGQHCCRPELGLLQSAISRRLHRWTIPCRTEICGGHLYIRNTCGACAFSHHIARWKSVWLVVWNRLYCLKSWSSSGNRLKNGVWSNDKLAHMLHVWNIYLHLH